MMINAMLRAWRYLWITTTVLSGLLLLLLLIVSQLDPNLFKETIETQVSELTGRQLKIDGNLQIDLSMQPLVRIEKVSFANAPWSKRPQMLSLELLQLKIKLRPLFDKKLVVEQLLLKGVDLSIETNTDGQINWQLEKLTSKEPDNAAKPVDSAPFRLPILPVLKQVQLDAIHVYYRDATAELEADTVVESLQLSNSGIDEAINFSANGTVNQHPFSFSGETGFLTAVTTQNLLQQGVSLQFSADALGITLTAEGKIEHPATVEGIDIAVSLDADDLDKSFTAATGKSIYHYLRKSKQPLSLNFSTKVTDITEGYHFSTIKFKLADNDINGDLSFLNRPNRPEIIAKLHSDKINLNQLLVEQPQRAKKPEIKSSKTKTNKTAIKLPDTMLPFDLLESLDADVNYTIRQLRFDEFNPQAIKLDASLHDGLLQVKQFDLNLYGTAVRSSLTVDSRSKTPRINTTLDIDQLQLSLLSQQLKIEQLKAGTFRSRINLNTRGKGVKSLVMNLKGKASIQLADVKLEYQLKNKKHNADIKQLYLDFSGINEPLSYDLTGAIDGEPLSLSGQLDSPASIIENKTLKLKLKLAAVKAKLELDGSIVKPLDADTAQLNISLDMPEPRASIIQISHLVPKVQLSRKIPKLPVILNGILTVSPDTYRVEKLRVNVGNSDLSGNVFADLRGEKPFIDAKLESQLLELNALVPATRLNIYEEPQNTEPPLDEGEDENNDDESNEPEKTKIFSTEPLPAFDALNNIDINLNYDLKMLTSNNQTIDNISLNLVLKDSLLRLDPLSIDFAKGTIVSTLELNVANKPRFQFDSEIIKLDYDRLMAILGTKEYARGELDAEISLTGEGNSVSALMASLDGQIRVTTVDGELDSDALKLLSKDLVSIIPFTDTSNRQKINCGVVQFNIKKGVASTHSMVINTGAVSALGTGDIDLASETLSLYIAPRSKRTSVIELALVPVNITGPLNSPSVIPDLAGSTISTTKAATNIGLTIATSGLWLLAEGLTYDLWDKFIDDTDYCARALAGDEIVPTRITLDSSEKDNVDGSDDLYDDDDDW